MTSHLEHFIEEENNREDFEENQEKTNPETKPQMKPRLQRKQSQDIRRIMPRDMRIQSRQAPPCNNDNLVLLQQANTQRNLLRRDLEDSLFKLQQHESYMNMLQQSRIEQPKPKCRACKNQNAQTNRKYCNSCASKRKKCSSLDCDMKCGFDYDYCFHCSRNLKK